MNLLKPNAYTEDVNVHLRINWVLVIAIGAVVVFLLGILAGNAIGKWRAEAYPSLGTTEPEDMTGKVTSANGHGLKVDTHNGVWKIRYAETTQFQGNTGPGEKSSIKKGDTVEVIGVGNPKRKTATARTVIIVTLPSPSPSATPQAKK